ncbi:MAG: hypothetical protein GF421_10860 [Candidatus Aminicenantes bacterium]|nr:hypothetical protein [Candidatus Aminicenantes bacterium]
MHKRKATFLGLLIALNTITLSHPYEEKARPSELLSLYKKGTIVCSPDPEFAKNIDWGSLFLDSRRQIKVAPDGTIFVSSQRDHSISQFSPDGIFQKNFGKKGKGPGDMELPGNMNVLDERFLVISDRRSNHRINLFHLDGTFYKMLKTQRPPSFPEALSKNKIAYIYSIGRPPARADSLIFRYLRKVIIKDVLSGEEKEVVEYMTSMNPIKDGSVIIARTGGGQLLVGMNLKPELDIYDLSGQKIRSIALDISPLKVNDKIRKHHQMRFTMTTNGKPTTKNAPIGDYLPFYKDLYVDSQGNILVFLMTENPQKGPFPLQVYSPEGKFFCQTKLDTENYVFQPDPKFNKFDFTEKGIFFILHKKEDEMETPHLVRIKNESVT